MATSRRRERELARRRFERRRQAELERRARAKRRNTVLGAVIGTIAVIVALVLIGVTVFGGSGKKKTSVKPATTPTATPTSTNVPKAPKKCAPIKPNPPAKGQPTIPDVKGKPSTKLVTKDIKVGHGPAAKDGDSLTVDYIGVSCSTGTVFDATYKDGGQPFTVSPLGSAGVITGWNQGLVGMKAGGVRELIIPASLGYGAAGSGTTIKPNETLIFLVTAKTVTAGK